MLRLLTRVQLAYVGVFFACCIGVFSTRRATSGRCRRCEQHGGWWSARYHECATPIPIWRITGRIPQGWAPIAGRSDATRVPGTAAPSAKRLTLSCSQA